MLTNNENVKLLMKLFRSVNTDVLHECRLCNVTQLKYLRTEWLNSKENLQTLIVCYITFANV